MIKRIFKAINRVLLLGATPSTTLSQKWREDELPEHEKIENQAMGIY